jgi:hypothetical protein
MTFTQFAGLYGLIRRVRSSLTEQHPTLRQSPSLTNSSPRNCAEL